MPRAPTNALTSPSSRMHPEVRRDLARFRAQIDCPLARERALTASMFARIGVMRALNRHVERVFNPERKERHWGRRKLARDR